MAQRLILGMTALLLVLSGCSGGSDADDAGPDDERSVDAAAVPSAAPVGECSTLSESLYSGIQTALRDDEDLTIVEAVAVLLDEPQDPFRWAVAVALDDGTVATLAIEDPESTLRILPVDERAKEVFSYGELLPDDDPNIQAAATIGASNAPTDAAACLNS